MGANFCFAFYVAVLDSMCNAPSKHASNDIREGINMLNNISIDRNRFGFAARQVTHKCRTHRALCVCGLLVLVHTCVIYGIEMGLYRFVYRDTELYANRRRMRRATRTHSRRNDDWVYSIARNMRFAVDDCVSVWYKDTKSVTGPTLTCHKRVV